MAPFPASPSLRLEGQAEGCCAALLAGAGAGGPPRTAGGDQAIGNPGSRARPGPARESTLSGRSGLQKSGQAFLVEREIILFAVWVSRKKQILFFSP